MHSNVNSLLTEVIMMVSLASNPREETSPALAMLVADFLTDSGLTLSVENRILDICSEYGEVLSSLYGVGSLHEEVGDLLFSVLALSLELNLALVDDKTLDCNDHMQLGVLIGQLCKESLRSSSYGQSEADRKSPGLREMTQKVLRAVYGLALGNNVEPRNSLVYAIEKYKARLVKTKSVDSRGFS